MLNIQSLRATEGVFRTLMEEFGTTSAVEGDDPDLAREPEQDDDIDLKVGGGKLILEEEREIGAVSWHIYYSYAKSMGSMWWAVGFSLFLAATQAAQVFNSLFLGFWTGKEISGFSNGEYMAVYAGMLSDLCGC